MRLHRKQCFYTSVIFAVMLLLSACRSEFKENTTIIDEQTTGANVSTTTGSHENGGTNGATTYVEETGVEQAKTTSEKSEKPQTRSTEATTVEKAVTTIEQSDYNEWTYRSVRSFLYPTGNQVTYTENPNNAYIILASEQLDISVNNLSATYNSKGATVFLFSSPEKNKTTLTDCVIIFADKMTIEKNIRVDGTTSSNKALADILYVNAMEHKTN